MTPHYVITRTRDTVTSICRSCGDTSGPTRTDAQAERWQRDHTAEHRPVEGRRTASRPVQGR